MSSPRASRFRPPSTQHVSRSRVAVPRSVAALLSSALVLLSIALPAIAQPRRIAREADVRALFQPFGEDRDPAPGWRISALAIEPARIVARLESESGEASVELHPHTTNDPSCAETASFRACCRGDAGADRACDALVRAVRENDQGRFWETTHAPPTTTRAPPSTPQSSAWAPTAIAGVLCLVALSGLWFRQRSSSTPRSTRPSSGSSSDVQGG